MYDFNSPTATPTILKRRQFIFTDKWTHAEGVQWCGTGSKENTEYI